MATEGNAAEAGAASAGQRAIWLRIGGGVTLISVLLALLALLDDRRTPAPTPSDVRVATEPAPNIVTEPRAPVIGAAVSLPAPEAPVLAALPAEATAAVEAAPEGSAAPEVVPPEARQADAPPPSASNADAVAQGASAQPDSTVAVAPEPDDSPAAPVASAVAEVARIAPAKDGFLVQLGVFGVSGNAEAMYAELKKLGVPARLETRVVAGPFPNRKSAEAARERLARAGLAKGIVVESR